MSGTLLSLYTQNILNEKNDHPGNTIKQITIIINIELKNSNAEIIWNKNNITETYNYETFSNNNLIIDRNEKAAIIKIIQKIANNIVLVLINKF